MKDDVRRLSEVLKDALGKSPLRRGLLQQEIFAGWKDVVGEEIARHSEILGLSDGILWVRVEGSVWAQELNLLKGQIQQRLEQQLGEGTVQDVRFHSGSKPPPV